MQSVKSCYRATHLRGQLCKILQAAHDGTLIIQAVTPARPEFTPYAAVMCHGDCGQVLLTKEQYDQQMQNANRPWLCPNCGNSADFDDTYFETLHPSEENADENNAVPTGT
jgi:hypothetical protein